MKLQANLLLIAMLAVGATVFTSCKKDGCTDPAATNYDPDAKDDDGSCVYPEIDEDDDGPISSGTLDSYKRLEDGEIKVYNNTWSAFAGAASVDDLVKVTGPDADDTDGSLLKQHLNDNSNVNVGSSVVTGISRTQGSGGLNPTPVSDFMNTASVPSSVNQESYRGAFSSAGTPWIAEWTALSDYGYLSTADMSSPVAGGNTVNITDASLEANQTYNWTNDNTYILDGLVFLESGATLNIEAGTVIKGVSSPTNGDNTSSLIITRGAQIFAEGTSTQPIIFTAENDPLDGSLLSSDCGQWGGVIILGAAQTYSDGNTEVLIEGLPSTETRGEYGGMNDGDNSGNFTYVSIRHSGVGIAPGDEIQGLTLGGVGSGTTIDYVEVYSSCDDGIEIFGGTADIRHISVAFATDDSYDFDLGWRGSGQYLFAIQLSGGGDAYDKAGEWDGAKPDDANLYSRPDLANMTLIGPGSSASGASNALVMRDGFGGSVYNSILVDYPGVGIEIEDLP